MFLVGVAIVALVTLDRRNERLVLTQTQLLHYGLGGRLNRAIDREDIQQVVYQPILVMATIAGSTVTVPFAFLLGKSGAILLETTANATDWSGGLPKLWTLLGIEPSTNTGVITLEQMRQLHDPHWFSLADSSTNAQTTSVGLSPDQLQALSSQVDSAQTHVYVALGAMALVGVISVYAGHHQGGLVAFVIGLPIVVALLIRYLKIMAALNRAGGASRRLR
jgi:hypothetical protein